MKEQHKKYNQKVVILAFFIIIIAGYFSLKFARAAIIDNREVRISNSIPAATASYDFLGDTSASTIKCIKMRFCDSVNTNEDCIAPTGIDATGATIASSGWNVFDYSHWTINQTSLNSVQITYNTGENGGSSSSWVLDNIINPAAAGVFYIWINTYDNTNCVSNEVDNGVVATATIAGVDVSATVLETLTFAVAGVSSTNCTVSGGTNVTTTSTSVPFGTVNSEAFYNGCQELTISTNASNGYDVTIGESDQLKSTGLDEIADGNCDGSCNDSTAASWATASNNGFGYCMDDISGDGAETADANWGTYYCGAGTQYFKTMANLSEGEIRQKIMQSASATSSDRSYVGFRLSVDAAQPAGTYTNIVSYIATPKY